MYALSGAAASSVELHFTQPVLDAGQCSTVSSLRCLPLHRGICTQPITSYCNAATRAGGRLQTNAPRRDLLLSITVQDESSAHSIRSHVLVNMLN